MVRSHFRERYQSVGKVLKLKDLRSTTPLANTVNLLTPVQKAPSSSASAEISALRRSQRGQRSITPWQIGATLAVLGVSVMFKLLPSTQTASQQNSEAPVTSASISSQAANFLNQGNQLRDSGEHEKALAAYDKALKVKPDYLEASWSQCYAFNQLQRYLEALAACEDVLIKPDYYNAWWSKGYALDELQRYQEALSAYDQALKIKPDFSEAWSNRGATLNHLQRYQEALIR